jgi:hypothetical protein
MLKARPGPTEVLDKICKKFLTQKVPRTGGRAVDSVFNSSAAQVAALVYITNSENYGRETVGR